VVKITSERVNYVDYCHDSDTKESFKKDEGVSSIREFCLLLYFLKYFSLAI
jgi:hypothetical protein